MQSTVSVHVVYVVVVCYCTSKCGEAPVEVQAGSRGKRLPVPPPPAPLPPPPPLALRGGEAWRRPPVCRCALRFGGDLLRKCGCMSTWCGAAREGWPARRPVSKRAWRTAASLSTIRSLYGDDAIATQRLGFYSQHHQLHVLVLNLWLSLACQAASYLNTHTAVVIVEGSGKRWFDCSHARVNDKNQKLASNMQTFRNTRILCSALAGVRHSWLCNCCCWCWYQTFTPSPATVTPKVTLCCSVVYIVERECVCGYMCVVLAVAVACAE